MAVESGLLWFWRVKPRKKVDPLAICKQLADDQSPPELQAIPITDILTALRKVYRTMKFDRRNRVAEVDLPEERAAVEPRWGDRHFVFTFYGDAWAQMDRVVGLMTRIGLTCYDSNERKMYTLKKPPRFTGTAEEEAVLREWERIIMEESAKIRASASNPREAMQLMKAFVDSDGLKLAREEAVRRARGRGRA